MISFTIKDEKLAKRLLQAAKRARSTRPAMVARLLTQALDSQDDARAVKAYLKNPGKLHSAQEVRRAVGL